MRWRNAERRGGEDEIQTLCWCPQSGILQAGSQFWAGTTAAKPTFADCSMAEMQCLHPNVSTSQGIPQPQTANCSTEKQLPVHKNSEIYVQLNTVFIWVWSCVCLHFYKNTQHYVIKGNQLPGNCCHLNFKFFFFSWPFSLCKLIECFS